MTMTRSLAACALALLACVARADDAHKDAQGVWDAAMQAASKGPADVPLLDQAVLHLPAGEVFVPQPQADRLLAVFGNPGGNPEMPGLILPRNPGADWYMQVLFHRVGHVADDEARTWDVDAMMAGYRAGTTDQNVARAKAGQPQIEVIDWAQRPLYDPTAHRLVWAMSTRIVGAPDKSLLDINYNIHVLDREGYFSLTLVTPSTDLKALDAIARRQVDALEIDAGKRYADFDPRTDHTASHGLAALILGEDGQRADDPGAALAFVSRNAVPLLLGVLALLLAAGVLLLRRRAAGDRGEDATAK